VIVRAEAEEVRQLIGTIVGSSERSDMGALSVWSAKCLDGCSTDLATVLVDLFDALVCSLS